VITSWMGNCDKKIKWLFVDALKRGFLFVWGKVSQDEGLIDESAISCRQAVLINSQCVCYVEASKISMKKNLGIDDRIKYTCKSAVVTLSFFNFWWSFSMERKIRLKSWKFWESLRKRFLRKSQNEILKTFITSKKSLIDSSISYIINSPKTSSIDNKKKLKKKPYST
jgi:hypothetical protein